MALLIIVLILFVFYTVLIFFYWQSWISIPTYISRESIAGIPLSVIIPARNEEKNIGRLLTALKEQNYPPELIEIIVIDDHSTDKTAEIVKQFTNVKLVQLNDEPLNSYKKKAIETGIAAANGQLIITTDADCWCGKNWLQTIISFYEEKKSVFIAAPVSLNCNNRIVETFQALDFVILQGITGASVNKNFHSMCNGANLAYERTAFYEVNGFKNIDTIASGDDMLLMHKMWKKYSSKVHYLKSADSIIHTEPMKSWKDFFNQRIRWASKSTRYDDKRIFLVLLLVYLLNLSFLVMIIAGFGNTKYWLYALCFWIVKTIVEFPFLSSVARFFEKQYLVKYFFFFQPLHIAYTIVAGFFGQFGKYEWKGRKVK